MISRKLETTLLLAFLLVQLFSVLSVHVITIKGSPDVDNPEHIHLTYQGDPASTVTVTWQTSTPTASNTVLYDTVSRGGTPSLYRYSATGSIHTYDGASGYIHDVELTNLEANTTYYFICGGPGIFSEERSFRTAPRLVSDFKFVVGGDSRTNLTNRVKVSQAMSHTNPSFVMHTGDLVTDGTIQSQWDTWFTDVNDNWVGDNGLTIPLIPCLGNHEKNATNYYGQFALPTNEQWYYYDWGPTVRVIVLNSEASSSQISIDQLNWLESVLAATPEYKWKFVLFHRNVYYAGRHPNATDLQQYWVPVFDKYHVDMVFQGHTHHYHRTKPMKNNSIVPTCREGTIYVTTGGWGAPLYEYNEQSYSAYGNKTLHFILVSIYRNGTLYLEAKDVNGYSFDDLWLYNDVDNPEHTHLTYQGDPASTVTVTWQTSTPTASTTVLYDTISRGGTPSLYRYSATGSSHTYEGASGYIHDVELTNLEANTTYYFICGGPGIYSEERSFRTAPRLVSDFKFVVGGDSQLNLPVRVKVSQAMRHTNPSFVMHCGDFVMEGLDQSHWDAWFTDVNDNWVGDNGLTIPLIPCLGNHEHNATNYYGQFALPTNEQWYYYDWGPTVRVIILNSDASPSQISTDQVNWLESVLASTPEYKWKFVMFHRNVYPVGGLPNATNLQQYWVPVFDKYHVDIVFQGHSHYYHRTRPLKNNSIVPTYREGTIYVTSGGWSSPLQEYQDARYSAYGNKTFHFTLVSIYRNGTLHLEAKDVNGYSFDDLWLYNDVKYWNFANGIYLQTAANITQPPLLSNNYLKLTIDAPNGTTSTTEIYCANIGKPHTVDGVSSWCYDDYTKILIANVTVTHTNLATTVMVVFDTDTDDDGLTNEEEVTTYGTNPTSADTDGDKLADGEEVVTYGTSPTSADTDGDELSDGEEVTTYGTSPTSADTDGDKLADGEEVQQGMDPLNHDTDHDLFGDSIDPLPMLNNWFIILPGLGLVVALGVAIRIRSK